MRLAVVLSTYLRARNGRRFSTRARLLAWQDQQVQAHLRRLLPRSPLLARRFSESGLSISQWSHLPLMDKAQMMAEFDALNTVGVRRVAALAVALRAEQSRDASETSDASAASEAHAELNGVTVGLSSGTSGSRGLFLVSPRERWQWAGAVLARVLPGSLLQPQRVAFFLRVSSNLYSSVAARHIRFEYFDLGGPLQAHLARLNDLQPTILAAPPSMLRRLGASAALRIRPEKIIAVAEVLDPLDEAIIARRFGQRVHQVYQATEGFLGATCRHGTLHLNEDLLVVQREVVDAARRKFVPIITDFHRTSQPIIRYRLDDLLTERAAPCPCGSPRTALEMIEGRCGDVFLLPAACGPAHTVRVFPDDVRQAVIASSPALESYHIVQCAPGRVEVAFSAPNAERAAVQAAITAGLGALWARLGGEPPALAFVPQPAHDPARKLQRVRRAFTP